MSAILSATAARTVNPATVHRAPDATPFSLYRAAPTRFDILASAARLGSPRVRDAVRTLLELLPNETLPFATPAHSEAMALDVADLVESWADASEAYTSNPADVLSLAVIRWSGRKLATMGIIPATMVDPAPTV